MVGRTEERKTLASPNARVRRTRSSPSAPRSAPRDNMEVWAGPVRAGRLAAPPARRTRL
jgi:hypothetical protein